MPQEIKVARGSRLVVSASVCVVVAALYLAREVLIPLALSILFTFLLTPLVIRLERWRLPRVVAVLLVVGASVGMVVGIGYVVQRQFVATAEDLPHYTGRIKAKVAKFTSMGGGLFSVAGKLEQTMKEIAPTSPATQPATTQPAATAPASQPATANQPGTAPSTTGELPPNALTPGVARSDVAGTRSAASLLLPMPQPPTSTPAGPPLDHVSPENPLPVRNYPTPESPVALVGNYLGTIVSPLATAGMVLVFVIFMLMAREDMRDRAIRLISGQQGHVTLTTTAFDDATKRVSRFLLMQLIVNATYGVVISTGLLIIGLFTDTGFPNFILWGLLCTALRFVPYIGPFIAAAFPLALSFAMFEHWWVFIAVGVLFLAVELFTNNVMEPRLYGSSTGMSEVAILVSAVFWTWLWGPIGLLMSTPLTVCLVVLGRHVPALKFLDVLLGDEPVLDPPTRTYQRLLARDEDEAEELASEMLNEQGLERVYDGLLMPVLCKAEYDRRRGSLDPERHDFIRGAVRELISDLADLHHRKEIATAAQRAVDAAKGQAPADTTTPHTAPITTTGNGNSTPPDGASCPRMVCLPAADVDDELAGLMLAELLKTRGCGAKVATHQALAGERVDATDNADLIIISALPPSALAHARYMLKRVRGRSADVPVLVGLWQRDGDAEADREALRTEGTVRVTRTLGQALAQVRELLPPDKSLFLLKHPGEPEAKTETKGTTLAVAGAR